MENKDNSLIDMIYDLLLRWRMFLIWILVGAVAFSVLGYVQSQKKAKEETALVEEASKLFEELLSKNGIDESDLASGEGMSESANSVNGTEESSTTNNEGTVAEPDPELLEETVSHLNEKQLANVDYVLNCERIYQEREDYIENSVIMKMDAQDVKKALVTAWIYSESANEDLETEQGSDSNQDNGEDQSESEEAKEAEELAVKQALETKQLLAITMSYANAIKAGDMAEYVSKKVDIPASYLAELFTVTALTSGNVYGITVEVIHGDGQSCKEIAQAVAEYIESKRKDLAKISESFDIMVEIQDIRSIADQNVIVKQQDAYDKALALKNVIEDKKAEFTQYELEYYDLCKNGKLTNLSKVAAAPVDINTIDLSDVDLSRFILNKDDEANGAVKNMAELQEYVDRGVTTKPGFSMKAALIGALAMAVIYGVYACFAFTFHDKVLDTDDFMQLCEIPQLGLIPTEKKKKFLSAVDAWIISKRDKKKRKFSQEEAIQFSSVAAKMEADQKSADVVSLVCCGFQEKDLAICGRIKEKLEKENVKTLILNNVLYDTGAMQGLRDVKGAVLVAKAGSTLYEELSQEMEMLGRQEVPVLGGIVIA